jgi:poly(hydroxyalkanoate) depolymerase family esterase
MDADSFDWGTGWSILADHYGFALLMPEQQRSNNLNRCFNWFNPQDIRRESGETCSISQMIAWMIRNRKDTTQRIFVTGLSAGGAMTSAMLAIIQRLLQQARFSPGYRTEWRVMRGKRSMECFGRRVDPPMN